MGVGGERAPSCGGARGGGGGGGRRVGLPVGTPPWPAGTGNRSSRNFPRRGSGLGGQQKGPEAAGRAGRIWGRMMRAAAAARAEAGRGRRLSQLPWNPVIREAAVGEGEELRWPEGAGRGVGLLQVPVSWRSWQRSSNPRDVRAGAFGRGEREPGPRPRKRQARAAAAKGPEGGREASGAGSAGLAPGGLRLREDSARDWSRGSRCVSL